MVGGREPEYSHKIILISDLNDLNELLYFSKSLMPILARGDADVTFTDYCMQGA